MSTLDGALKARILTVAQIIQSTSEGSESCPKFGSAIYHLGSLEKDPQKANTRLELKGLEALEWVKQ